MRVWMRVRIFLDWVLDMCVGRVALPNLSA